MELSTQNLMKYIDQVSKLEASVYEQERCYAEAKTKLVYCEPSQENKISKPIKQKVSEPIKLARRTTVFIVLGIIFLCICVASFILGTRIDVFFLYLVFFGIASIIMFILFAKAKKTNKWYTLDYERQMIDYNQKVIKENERYEQEMKVYEQKVNAANEAHRIVCEEYKRTFEYAKESVDKMLKPLDETKTVLQKYYDMDIVFPKYRTFAAMCTISEYFKTGRCTELIGPNGAYNLYESELRQNIIINKLDTVIEQLDQIKNNQYLLYTELQKVNQKASYIAGTTTMLLDSSKRIEANTAITAYCSEITAANTAAIAAMAFLG